MANQESERYMITATVTLEHPDDKSSVSVQVATFALYAGLGTVSHAHAARVAAGILDPFKVYSVHVSVMAEHAGGVESYTYDEGLVKERSVYNHYIAVLEGDVVRATWPNPAKVAWKYDRETQIVSGFKGAMSCWNGKLPNWCTALVEVRSVFPWEHVPEEDKTYWYEVPEEFLRAYVEAALWTTDFGETSALDLDAGDDIDPALFETVRKDCAAFYARAKTLISDSEPRTRYSVDEYAGHDFWLTRNGHGAGFWDGDWPKHGDALTVIAQSFGETWIYVGDDGRVYGRPSDEEYRGY